MKLEMPLIDRSLRGGKILRWTRGEGDGFGFGDEMCVVAIDEFAALRRTARATLLSGRRRKRIQDDVEVRGGKVYVEVTLTSADSGVVRKIVTDVGDPVAVGDLLAVISTDDHAELEGTERDWREAPAMRVVANPLHPDDEHFEERN